MWTTFKEQKSKLQGKGYTGGFVEWNCKATNDYSDKKYLAYALNVYPHVGIVQFFLTAWDKGQQRFICFI